MQELPELGVTIQEVDLAPFAALSPEIHARHRDTIGADLLDAVAAMTD